MHLPKPWRLPLLTLVLAWGLLGLLYAQTGAAMVAIWNRSETFAHAWTVPPISAWLVWRMRGVLAPMEPRPWPVWLLALLPLGFFWLLGEMAAANSVTQFAMLGMGVVLVPALLGRAVAAQLMFPLGFLFFAVPFGDFLTPWLIDRTADFTVMAVRASGIPLFREGNQFVIPTGSWSVVDACSGIRYLMASLMVGTLFAYLNYRSNRKRWAFVAVAIVTPLVANWLRAYMIVMLGHLSGNRLAVGVDHIIYGWVFFGIIMLAMFMIGARWSDPEPAPAVSGGSASQALTPSRGLVLSSLAAAVLLLALPAGMRANASHQVVSGQPVVAMPDLPGLTWVNEPNTDWVPHFMNPAGTAHGRYESTNGGPAVGVFIGYYRDQRQGRQLVTSVNVLASPEAGVWARTAAGVTELDGHVWRTASLRGQTLGQLNSNALVPRLRVWQIYWINGRPFSSDWQAKAYGAVQGLLGHGDDAAVVLVYADPAVAGADDELLRDFVHKHWGRLDTALRGVRDQAPAAGQ